ncbi:MAG: hypothetical protein LAT56_14675 [Wenzhouxiangella sp.]|nr:hypothetical protein [Wenzhouxiangella sp.]
MSPITSEQAEQAKVALDQAFKEGKRKGAKSMAKLVKEMRQAQNRYFETRSDEALRLSKKLESQVDRAVEAVLG